MITHIIAELECALLGHINWKGDELETDRCHPGVVKYHYYRGDVEKVADNTCANCGHFIIEGKTRIRGQVFTPDYLKNDPPQYIKDVRDRWNCNRQKGG